MSLERKHQFLEVLGENPSQSFEKIRDRVSEKKHKFINRGPNSEVIVSFLIQQFPEVTNLIEWHARIDGLDCDKIVEFINTDPINLQIKTREASGQKFLERLNEVRKKSKNPIRWIVIDLEQPFDKIQRDFVDQVNKLDGRRTLRYL